MASSGNFCTLNPLTNNVGTASTMNGGTFSVGNLKYAMSGEDGFRSNYAITHKSYCEVYINSIGNYGGTIGFGSYQNEVTYEDMVTFQMNFSSGRIYHYKGASAQSPSIANIGGTVSTTSVVMMAYDPATYKWWVGVDGTWRNSGDPANGTGFVFQGSSTMFEDMRGVFWGGWKGGANGLTCHWNFGQDSTFGGTITAGGNADENGFGDFKYSPPTGFLALCSGNEVISSDIDPAQTDDNFPGKQFNVVTYTGTGSDGNNITGLGFEPDLVWFKNRSNGGAQYKNNLADTTRGVSKVVYSDAENAEETNGDITSFDSDGFTVGGSGTYVNASSQNYVAWCWRANGGTTASNSEGDVTSTVQANQAAGFSIVEYVGNRSSAGTSTVGHGLGGVPDMFITKPTSHAGRWYVWHTGMSGASYMLELNTTSAEQDKSANGSMSLPTSTVFDITYTQGLGESGETHIGYFWRSIDGYSKFAKYTGNGDADGPYVYTGFRPRMIFIKNSEQSSNWGVYDSARQTFNPNENYLRWNSNAAEGGTSTSFDIDFLSNGFKVRSTETDLNTSGKAFIYGAWADVPFKYNNTF